MLLDCVSAVSDDSVLACPEGELATRARAAGLTVVTIEGHRRELRATVGDRLLAPARLAAHGLELRGLARRLDAGAVVGWGMRSAIACLALPGRVPIAVAHNDMLPGPAIAAAVRRAAARARVVIVPSRAVALDLDRRGELTDRLRIVHPGVELGRFAAQWSAAEPPEIVVVGAMVAWKRPELALEAVAIARRIIPTLRLRFVGAPLSVHDPTPAKLRERAAALGLAEAVQIAGADAAPERFLSRACCLLHCADREPFGLVIAEALAAGCPVVVPDAGGPLDIVDRSCGLLYEAGDAEGAAHAIVEVVTDREAARRLSAAGRRRARERFDRTDSVAGFAQALGGLAPTARGAGPPQRTLMSEPSQLTLVTVTHDSRRELEALLASARHHLPGAHVVVVDNGSVDGTVELAKRACDRVTTVALADNIGFGRACNRGLEEVRTAAVALVNPDVELVDDSLLALASEAVRRNDRLLAPLVLNGDGTRQDTVHPVPSSAADLVRSLVSPAGVPPPLGAALWPSRASRPRRVGWAVGCALVGSATVLRRLGPFDESIFLYGEDLELGLRAAQNGVETWFWPAGRVIHHGAHSARAEFGAEPFERLARARHDVVRRRLGPARAALDDRAQAATFGSRLVLKRALGINADRERRQLLALRAVRRGGDAT